MAALHAAGICGELLALRAGMNPSEIGAARSATRTERGLWTWEATTGEFLAELHDLNRQVLNDLARLCAELLAWRQGLAEARPLGPSGSRGPQGDQLIYLQRSADDLPPPLDAGGLVAAVAEVFDEVAEGE